MENENFADIVTKYISNVIFYSRKNNYKNYPLERLNDYIHGGNAFDKSVAAIKNLSKITESAQNIILNKISNKLEFTSNKDNTAINKFRTNWISKDKQKNVQNDEKIKNEADRLAKEIVEEIMKESAGIQLVIPESSSSDENDMYQSQMNQSNTDKKISSQNEEQEMQDMPEKLIINNENTTIQYIPKENDEAPVEENSDYGEIFSDSDEASIFENTENIPADEKDEQYNNTPFDIYAVDLMMQMKCTKVSIGNFALSKQKTCIENIIKQIENSKDNLIEFIKDYPEFDKYYLFSLNIKNFSTSVIQKCKDIIENINNKDNVNRDYDYAQDLTSFLADAIRTYILNNIIYNMCMENISSKDYKVILEKIVAFLETLGLYTIDKPAENEMYNISKFSFFYESTPLIVENPDMHGIVAKVNIPALFIDYYDADNCIQKECIKGKITVYTNMG